MKTRNSILYLIGFLLASCNQVVETAKEPNKAIILIKDVSASNDFAPDKMQAYLQPILSSGLTQNGDKVLVIPAGRSSFDVGQVKGLTLNYVFTDPTGLSELKSKQAEQSNIVNKRAALLSIKAGLLDLLQGRQNDNETHLLASLATLQEVVKPLVGYEINVYLFSDLREYSHIRQMQETLLTSKREAKKMAEADLKTLNATFEIGISLSDIHSVTLVSPSCMNETITAQNNYGFLVLYWTEILNGLGIATIHLETTCP